METRSAIVTVCDCVVSLLVVCEWQVVEWHFWLKKNEILSQVGEWISDLETYSTDKRVGRSISHSCTSLKVQHLAVSSIKTCIGCG